MEIIIFFLYFKNLKAVQDHHFVQSTLSNVVENDEFWQKLLNVYETARNEGRFKTINSSTLLT